MAWLQSKETSLTLNLKLGYTPLWHAGPIENQNAIQVFLGIWYGRYDEERTNQATLTRSHKLSFCIGILPVELDNSECEDNVDNVEGKDQRSLADDSHLESFDNRLFHP